MENIIMRNFVERPLLMVAGGLVLVSFIVATACSSVMQAAGDGVTAAVSGAVEREVERSASAMIENYSSAMLYQLAYTQAFHVGGYGIGTDNFAEGEGTTWEIESESGEETSRFTSERALLKVNDDGSSWWYLRYQPENDDPIEYEILMTSAQDPLQMYVKDPRTGDVDHYTFDHHREEMDEESEDLDEGGFNTFYTHRDEWEDYHDGTEEITIGGETYMADILFYQGTEEDGNEDVEVRWWIAEGVPGELIRYQMTDRSDDGGTARGEMTDRRTGYTAQFAEM